MLFLNKEEVGFLVSMEEVIGAVEEAFLKHAHGKTRYPPKSQFMLPTEQWRWWGFMPVYVEGMGVACKVVCDYPENKGKGRPTIIATIMLCDPGTGEVKAVMDATHLTALRTGALGAVAAKHLAREDAKTVGVMGCGVQARTQLTGLTKVRDIEEVRVYDINEGAASQFILDMRGLGLPIKEVDSKKSMRSDIVVAATVSKDPVVFGEEIQPGTHITSIGAHTPDAREVDDDLMRKSKVVIDSPDAKKSGDLQGFNGDLVEIKEVIAGKNVRTGPQDITLFKSVGTALQDVAIASLVYEKAVKAGAGKELG